MSGVDPEGYSYAVWYGLYDGTDDYGMFEDELGKQVRTEFDGWGRVSARQYPEGNRAEFTYDSYNNVTQMVAAVQGRHSNPECVGGLWQFHVQETCRPASPTPTAIPRPWNITGQVCLAPARSRRPPVPRTLTRLPQYINYTYNGDGQLLTVTDAEGRVTHKHLSRHQRQLVKHFRRPDRIKPHDQLRL